MNKIRTFEFVWCCMDCELSFEPICVSLAILFRFEKLPSEFELVKICRAGKKQQRNRTWHLKWKVQRINEKKKKQNRTNHTHMQVNWKLWKWTFSRSFVGIFFFSYTQCLNVCGNNVKWFWSQIWIVTQKNNVNKFLASKLRKNFESQQPKPKTWQQSQWE